MSRLSGVLWRALQSTLESASGVLGRLFGRWTGTIPILLAAEDAPVFPDPQTFDSFGLIALGGDLTTERLLAAYRSGIFPWYDDDTPILWWSPDPRAILEFDGLYVSRRLARTVRSGKFTVTFDAAFTEVMAGCSDREEGTWITSDMFDAYQTLHLNGHAHSVEIWLEGELVGGVYGVTVGGLFAGESMFSRVNDASKVALVHLVNHLKQRRFVLFDIQYLNEHTERLGGVEIPRAEYLRRLRKAIALDVSFA